LSLLDKDSCLLQRVRPFSLTAHPGVHQLTPWQKVYQTMDNFDTTPRASILSTNSPYMLQDLNTRVHLNDVVPPSNGKPIAVTQSGKLFIGKLFLKGNKVVAASEDDTVPANHWNIGLTSKPEPGQAIKLTRVGFYGAAGKTVDAIK
jgi:hypothetical protein